MAVRTELPIERKIRVVQGSSWPGLTIQFPDFTNFGGPHDLTNCVVKGQVRSSVVGESLADIRVDYLDRTERRVHIWLSKEDTLSPDFGGVWELEVEETGNEDWGITWYRGTVEFSRQVSR